jgi:hypothetical protein
MNELIYALCQKPVLGMTMFLATACAFPPLFEDVPLPLQQADAVVVKEFEAPVGKPYFLEIGFEFRSAASMVADEVVGSSHDDNCLRDYAEIPLSQRAALGKPIPVHVLIREKPTGKVVIDKVFNSLCLNSSSAAGFKKFRTVGRLHLEKGKYIAEIHNMVAQTGLDDVKTTVSLVAEHGK